jgi:nicotinamide mononucleotide transporter
MNVIDWLFDARIDIGNSYILWREVIGNALGLASAIGGMRRRVWAWPVGIVANLMLLTVFLDFLFENPQDKNMYGQASRQVFFIVVSVYGWVRWRANVRQRELAARSGTSDGTQAGRVPAVTPRWANAQERTATLALAAAGVVACYFLFRELGAFPGAQWWFFLADSWIFVGSILATYAMARGWVEFWLYWIAVDLVGVPLLWHSKFYPSAVLFAVYGGFVLWGFFVWRRVARQEADQAADPANPVAEAMA